jgi:hypothetical protein
MKAKRRYLPNFEARSVMIIAAWTIGSAAAAHAQTRPATSTNAATQQAAAFTAADTNHDGKLSHTEAQAIPMLAESFNRVDTDHDGFISLAEYEKSLD